MSHRVDLLAEGERTVNLGPGRRRRRRSVRWRQVLRVAVQSPGAEGQQAAVVDS